MAAKADATRVARPIPSLPQNTVGPLLSPGQPVAVTTPGHDEEGTAAQAPLGRAASWLAKHVGNAIVASAQPGKDFAREVNKAATSAPLESLNHLGAAGLVAATTLAAPESEGTTPEMLNIEHYSKEPALARLLPDYVGTGRPGAERRAGLIPSVHVYDATTPGAGVERQFANDYRYTGQVPASRVYDISTDPAGVIAKIRARNYGAVDTRQMQRAIQKAGYMGFRASDGQNPNIIKLFEPVDVTPAAPVKYKGRTFGADRGTDELPSGNFAVLTAENPNGKPASAAKNVAANANLRTALQQAGYDFTPVTGRYVDEQTNTPLAENSFLVRGIAPADAAALGRKFKQNSVLTHEGLHDLNSNVLYPSRGVGPATGNIFTQLPDGQRFASDLDFQNPQPVAKSVPRVMGDSVVSRVAAKAGFPAYSQLLTDIENAPQAKATGAQWAKALANSQSKVERDWTGMDQYLKNNAGTVLTRDAVRAQAQSRPISLGETTLGASRDEYVAWMRQLDEVNRRVKEASIPSVDGYPSARPLPGHEEEYDAALSDWRKLNDNEPKNPKFAPYVEPGGKNYREILTTLDTPPKTLNQWRVKYPNGFSDGAYDNQAAAEARAAEIGGTVADNNPVTVQGGFRSHHFPNNPNILNHLRLDDRETLHPVTGAPEKTLFGEELQSDWHQQGRQKGYGPLSGWRVLDAQGNLIARQPTREAAEAIANDYRNGATPVQQQAGRPGEPVTVEPVTGDVQGVPDAPYKGTAAWTRLGLKRALYEAANGGYDRFAWTTGDQQAARYDLSKQVDRLTYNDQTGYLTAEKGGRLVHTGTYDAKALPDVVGKEAAEKLLASPTQTFISRFTKAHADAHVLEGDDLKVGGAGMRGYYDQVMPKELAAYLKSLGVPTPVEPMTSQPLLPDKTGYKVVVTKPEDFYTGQRDVEIHDPEGHVVSYRYGTRATDEELLDNAGRMQQDEQSTHTKPFAGNMSIPITPELRARILAGQPLGAFLPPLAIGGGLFGALNGQRPQPQGSAPPSLLY